MITAPERLIDRRLDAAGLLDGVGAVVATPGGGLHLYYAGSGLRTGRLARHQLDFRADGYVLPGVAPRSAELGLNAASSPDPGR